MADLMERSGGTEIFGSERWARAEEVTQKILCRVSPTVVSQQRRRQVIDYVQGLIRNCLGAEVFPYGSVPLKTYLPDGDIDLTAFGAVNAVDLLANSMIAVLEGEEQNRAAGFIVKDVQLINAEVKLVKCIVQNIVVDISFNQIGGLSTLCFLEKVDQRIGKDHLFKRSIILIKSWCYYESRILGAHHGLISTYALETLVLYIFHHFHSTLNGPLAVLYKFLDCFSKFDWENYGISLTGPVRVSSLPDIVVETAEDGGSDVLLSDEFLKSCIDSCSVPSRCLDTNTRGFQKKYLNIVDPLRETNNLGRSVSKGSFYRIQSALTYGAKKLGQILEHPEDGIASELHKFFANTMARHGCGQRPDVRDPLTLSTCNGFLPASPISDIESCKANKSFSETNSSNHVVQAGDRSSSCDESSKNVINGGTEKKNDRVRGEQEGAMPEPHSTRLPEYDPAKSATLGHRLLGDANELATSDMNGLKISNGSPQSHSEIVEEKKAPSFKASQPPHLYFSNSKLCNGNLKKESSDSNQLHKSEENVCSRISSESDGETVMNGCILEKHKATTDEVGAHVESKDVLLAPKSAASSLDCCTTSCIANPESISSLDLSGDCDGSVFSLKYALWCFEYALGVPSLAMPPQPPPQYHGKNPWDSVLHPSLFRRNGFHPGYLNCVIPSQGMYPMNPLFIPSMAFGGEEMPKPRGTGTYFPNMNHSPQGYRSSAAKGRNQASLRTPRNSGRNLIFTETNVPERNNHDLSQAHVPPDQSMLKPGSPDVHQSFSPRQNESDSPNGSLVQSQGAIEFGSVGPLLERSLQQRPASSTPQPHIPDTSRTQRPNNGLSQDRNGLRLMSSYHLKDEGDFPPLSTDMKQKGDP